MPDHPYLQWPVFRRSVVAAFQRSLTRRSPSYRRFNPLQSLNGPWASLLLMPTITESNTAALNVARGLKAPSAIQPLHYLMD